MPLPQNNFANSPTRLPQNMFAKPEDQRYQNNFANRHHQTEQFAKAIVVVVGSHWRSVVAAGWCLVYF